MKIKESDKSLISEMLSEIAKSKDAHTRYIAGICEKISKNIAITASEKELVLKRLKVFKIEKQLEQERLEVENISKKAIEQQQKTLEASLPLWGKVFFQMQEKAEKPFDDILRLAHTGVISKKDATTLGIYSDDSLGFENLCYAISEFDNDIAILKINNQYGKIDYEYQRKKGFDFQDDLSSRGQTNSHQETQNHDVSSRGQEGDGVEEQRHGDDQ